MSQQYLNLGILAHVDAGKTTLTERLLFTAGVIDELGSVDRGTTQTDALALERQRGITIKSAVVAFNIGEIAVNLVDTPGHPDFIAEVERVLAVLDGAVVVVSAVEGVQPQTRILVRALQRLRIPTLFFINKTDRAGADPARVFDEIRTRLTPSAVALTKARGRASVAADAQRAVDDAELRLRLLEVLAERDEALLRAYIEEAAVPEPRLREALAVQTAAANVSPVTWGSARTGEGVDGLMTAIAQLLPAGKGDPEGPVSGLAFKVERAPEGHRIAYVRMFSGHVHARDRVRFGRGDEGKVTLIRGFSAGTDVQLPVVSAGQVAKLWGLANIQIGDAVGDPMGRAMAHEFPPPMFEAVVDPACDADRERLRTALAELSEQDPLINVRQDDDRHEISVSLFGDVQKEVVESTLATDYGIEVVFREATTICVERLLGTGEALEVLRAETKSNVTGKSSPESTNPFLATLGLRVAPARTWPNAEVRVDVDIRLLPLYVYKTAYAFRTQMTRYVKDALLEGLYGWRVTDCGVAITDCGYRAPGSTARDFRRLTPHVLTQALSRAGTVVCQPTMRVRLEVPTDTVGTVVAALGRLHATSVTPTESKSEFAGIEAVLSAERSRDLRRYLAGMTRGEGTIDMTFEGYEPVRGDPPVRPRTKSTLGHSDRDVQQDADQGVI